MIIDASNLILGRLATYVAKQSLLGEKVDIVNCEQAVISGGRRNVIAKFKQRRGRVTPFKGPFFPRMPDRFVRRVIRGMLPYKQAKGIDAYARVMCYIGVPSDFKGKDIQTLDRANALKRQTSKFVTVADMCKELGAKI